jgi:hypothetical protein
VLNLIQTHTGPFIDFYGVFDNTYPLTSGNLSTYNGPGTVVPIYAEAKGTYGWRFGGMVRISISTSAIDRTETWLAYYYPVLG